MSLELYDIGFRSSDACFQNKEKALQTLMFEELFYLGFRPSDISNQLLKTKNNERLTAEIRKLIIQGSHLKLEK